MSRSTTATTTYELTKYSRASTNGRSEADQEWQHFTNPTITLVVDAKKASNTGDIESFRTRVLWVFNAGSDSMATDQNEVVFVSRLEVVAFFHVDRKTCCDAHRRTSICMSSL